MSRGLEGVTVGQYWIIDILTPGSYWWNENPRYMAKVVDFRDYLELEVLDHEDDVFLDPYDMPDDIKATLVVSPDATTHRASKEECGECRMSIPSKVWYNPRLDPNTQYQISLTPQDGECWREHTVIASFKERDVRYVLCDQGLAVRLDSLDYPAHHEISIEWDAGFTKHSIEPHWCALLGYQGKYQEFSLAELAEIPSLLKRFEITEFMVYDMNADTEETEG